MVSGSLLGGLVLTATFMLSGCGATPTVVTPPRAELLTVGEALGSHGELSTEPGMEASTTCGPDQGDYLPSIRSSDPNVARFNQGNRWLVVGVWDDENNRAREWIEKISHVSRGDICTLGNRALKSASGTHESFDWRVNALDFGEDVAAFQAVEWSLTSGDTPPEEPVARDDLLAYSTARAYGIVNDKLVMVRISHKRTDPPTEAELRALWDAQVAKVRYFKALERSKELLTPQSGQTNK